MSVTASDVVGQCLLLSCLLLEVQRLVGAPVEADRPEPRRRFVQEAILGASHSERPKRERLNVRLGVHPMRGFRLNPFACAEGDERVQVHDGAFLEPSGRNSWQLPRKRPLQPNRKLPANSRIRLPPVAAKSPW